jgi:hypothetical protein
MEVRGSVTDRPWGLTLGAIALRRHTGQLGVESDGKRYNIAFQDGAIVAASSPLAADAIARIALTNHFITSTQVADITRRLATSSDRDEVDVLVEAIRCSPEQALKLRHRLVAQRAARTFSLERGDFVLDDVITLPVTPGVIVDHRHVMYLGVRTNLSEQRLLDDLRQLGTHFILKPEAIDDLPRYGFEPSAHPVLEALKVGTSLPELEASHRELDPRFAQAIIYALVSCTACVILPRAATSAPSASRTATPTPSRTSTPTPSRTAAPTVPRTTTPRTSRTTTPRSAPAVPRTATPRTATRHPSPRTSTRSTRTAGAPARESQAGRARNESQTASPAPRDAQSQTAPPQPGSDAAPRSVAGTQPPMAAGTATFQNLDDDRATATGRRATSPPGGRSPTPPSRGRVPTPPTTGRTMTSPFSSRTDTGSPSAYASRPQDSGTNTPAATRPRTGTETRGQRSPTPPSMPTAAPPVAPTAATAPATPPQDAPTTTTSPPSANRAAARATAPATAAIQTPPPGGRSRPATTPPPLRSEGDDVGKFTDIPTPSPLRSSARPTAVTFSDPQPTRASGARPTVSRAPTPTDAEFRGFNEQHTPSGFVEQRTPGFGEQRTPGRPSPDQRTPTDPSLPRAPTGPAGGHGSIAARVSTDNAVLAEEAFKRGELAMKRDQPGDAILEFKTACDLNPGDVDYAGMLAWAKFCAAGDKAAIGADTRKILERAVFKSNRPERARFYLGRVERMLGRDREALRHFHEVLDLKPNHAEAASEIRAIEARLQAAGKTGLFGRKR